jgi:hypothetical protein
VEGAPDAPAPPADPPAAQAEGLLVRVREMTAADAAREADRWVAAGAVPLEAPAPWRAWGRTRRDAVSGAPRVLRMAVAGSAPAVVVNWSALQPPGRAEEAAWAGALQARAPRGGGAGGAHGWTA